MRARVRIERIVQKNNSTNTTVNNQTPIKVIKQNFKKLNSLKKPIFNETQTSFLRTVCIAQFARVFSPQNGAHKLFEIRCFEVGQQPTFALRIKTDVSQRCTPYGPESRPAGLEQGRAYPGIWHEADDPEGMPLENGR